VWRGLCWQYHGGSRERVLQAGAARSANNFACARPNCGSLQAIALAGGEWNSVMLQPRLLRHDTEALPVKPLAKQHL
jgi:hypothetical protein